MDPGIGTKIKSFKINYFSNKTSNFCGSTIYFSCIRMIKVQALLNLWYSRFRRDIYLGVIFIHI